MMEYSLNVKVDCFIVFVYSNQKDFKSNLILKYGYNYQLVKYT